MKTALGTKGAVRRGIAANEGVSWRRLIEFILVVAVLTATMLLAWKLTSIKATEASPPVSPMAASARLATFGPTVENKVSATGRTPGGMAWIPGGEFSMGAQDSPDKNEVGMQATRDSRPIHRVYVDGFWMDKTDVTNEEFARFVRATRYITVAERKPRAEDFPGVPPQNLVPGAVVFSPPDHAVPLFERDETVRKL